MDPKELHQKNSIIYTFMNAINIETPIHKGNVSEITKAFLQQKRQWFKTLWDMLFLYLGYGSTMSLSISVESCNQLSFTPCSQDPDSFLLASFLLFHNLMKNISFTLCQSCIHTFRHYALFLVDSSTPFFFMPTS